MAYILLKLISPKKKKQQKKPKHVGWHFYPSGTDWIMKSGLKIWQHLGCVFSEPHAPTK